MIRLATKADVADMVRMGCQFIAESGYRGLLTPNPIAQRACVDSLLEEGQGGAWVVEADTELLVGMLGIALAYLPVSGELAGVELMWWLDPHWRRGSTGLRLLATGEDWARSRGARWLQMIQPAGNDAVGVLYRRLGFVPIETTWQKRLAA